MSINNHADGEHNLPIETVASFDMHINDRKRKH